MHIFEMTSTPVSLINLTGSEKITKDEYKILSNLKMKKRELEIDNSVMLSESSQILEDPELENIKNTKMKYVNEYLNNILGVSNNFKMTTSWLTMNRNGSVHERHSHGNVILSATLYFSEDLIDESMASFYISQKGLDHIFQNFQFQYNRTCDNKYNSQALTLPTKSNMLVIFPGWMLHGSNPHESSRKRFCIGSNYFIEDNVGTGYHSLDVKVQVKDKTLNG